MTKNQVLDFIRRIEYTYPSFKMPTDQKDIAMVTLAWYDHLQQFDEKLVIMAFRAFVATSDSAFAPSVSEVLAQIRKMATGDDMNELEAWALVSKALRNGYYGAEVEFEKLPPLVQKAVGSASNLRNWATSDNSSIETVIGSQFMRSYRTILHREQEQMMIPPGFRLAMRKEFLLADGVKYEDQV